MIFAFIEAEKANYPIRLMCRVLGVSRSGFHGWTHRPPSRRAVQDLDLTRKIRAIHKLSRETYGAPRVHMDLRFTGTRVGRKRVARLMRLACLQGSCTNKRRRRTTIQDQTATPSADLVNREFAADGPDRLWVADITYQRTWQGWLHLAFVLDAFSRKVVGWSMAEHLRTELVLDAFEMARWNRRPAPGLIHHSDRGTQYTSYAFGRKLRDAGILGSMGSVGDAYDNALAESFIATLKKELLSKRSWPTRASVQTAVFDYIEGWYNRRRRHTSIGYLSPAEFETMTYERTVS